MKTSLQDLFIMPYHVVWNDASQTIVRQTYEGRISRHDFENMVCESRCLLNSVSHIVDVIIEWQGDRHLINDFSIIHAAMFAETRVPSNQRFVFVVNAPTAYRILATVLQKAAPRAVGSLYFVDTLDAVYRLRDILLETELTPVS
jgi:hypothetical protein